MPYGFGHTPRYPLEPRFAESASMQAAVIRSRSTKQAPAKAGMEPYGSPVPDRLA